MKTIIEMLKSGISFQGGCYSISGPLTDHLIETLKNNEVDYDTVSKAVYEFMIEMSQFDNIELPDGTTFTKTFTPNEKR